MSIPKVIYFCNKTLDKMEIYTNNWKLLNPEYEIKLYDDEMCQIFLLEEYGLLYKNVFNYIRDGPIKADFWRICILYKYGGIYSDIDNQPLVPLNDFLEKNVDFATCSSFLQEYNFNPNFIVAKKNSIILENCINWYISKYMIRKRYTYSTWTIMKTFTDLIHIENYDKSPKVYKLGDMKIQILHECYGKNNYDSHNLYNGKRIFNNRYRNWDNRNHCFR